MFNEEQTGKLKGLVDLFCAKADDQIAKAQKNFPRNRGVRDDNDVYRLSQRSIAQGAAMAYFDAACKVIDTLYPKACTERDDLAVKANLRYEKIMQGTDDYNRFVA